MKKFLGMIILALVFTSFTGLTPNANKEIQFEKITFNQALAKAKKENKMVFMNVYATWCGPCMLLKKTTFKTEKIADSFNKSFINIDVDAEKGEGIELSKRYEVVAHPLMLVINPNGKVEKRILGYIKEEGLLKEVKSYLK
jgi:thioredoxin 1